MIGISFKADLKALERRADDIAKRQLPFAAAQALTAVARLGAEAERAAMAKALDRPEPFTLRGVAVKPARKAMPVAWVYLRPIQAHYLAPSILGGPQVLNANRAVLAPVDVRLDAWGNIPRRLLARLRGRADVFIGPVKTRAGVVNGVWQRVGGRKHGLKLLIRFKAPVVLAARYRFGEATRAAAAAAFPAALRAALARAVATAR